MTTSFSLPASAAPVNEFHPFWDVLYPLLAGLFICTLSFTLCCPRAVRAIVIHYSLKLGGHFAILEVRDLMLELKDDLKNIRNELQNLNNAVEALRANFDARCAQLAATSDTRNQMLAEIQRAMGQSSLAVANSQGAA